MERGANPTKLFSDPLTSSSPRRDAYSCTSVHAASQNGHLKCLKFLIETKNINPNILDSNRQTPLHHACENGHKNIVQYLLAHLKCIPTFKNKNRNTPLHFASRNGHLECVKLLFEVCTSHFIDPNARNKYKQTPVHHACFNGHSDIVKYLLTHATCKPNTKNVFGYTPLHLACRNGHLVCVELIIETSTVNIDTIVTKSYQTALHLACEHDRKNVTEYLLTRAKCSPNIQDFCRNTPLHVASHNGYLDCVKLIIEIDTVTVDPNLTNINMKTALHFASENGYKNVLQCLLTHAECNPNVQDIHGNTPLHIACREGYLECVKLIIETSTVRVDFNLTNIKKQTAVHLASENGHRNIAEYLLSHAECNPNIQDIHENTPLHISCRKGYLECVKLIVGTSTVRVEPNLANKDKKTALHLASENGHKDVTEYLLTHANCNPNIQDFCGSTPLHVASRKGHLECVKLIVEQNTVRVDPDLINESKETALFIACEKGHRDIVEYLLTHAKCNPNIKNEIGNSILHVASRNGHLEIVKFIIETSTVSIDPDEFNDCDQTALHLACRNERRLIIEYLLTHAKCSPNLKVSIGNNPLHLATLKGELEMVKLVIETSTVSIDPDVSNNHKQTALHIACKNGHSDIVEYVLIHTTCDPNIQHIHGNTPLHIASQSGHMECVKLIIETSTVRADPNLTNIKKQTAVHLASENGHRNIGEYLLSHAECNPNIQDINGNTPLHIACRKGYLECVKLIIETSTVRVEPNLANKDKKTALHIASENGYKSVLQCLLTHAECNPNVLDIHGNTPLHIACREDYLECVKLIIETSTVSLRVDFNLTNKQKKTALHLACMNGNKSIAEYLLTHAECNPNIQDMYGNTPLHIATWNSELELLKSIIETSTVSSVPDLSNNDRQTACRNGHSDIAEHFLTHTTCNPNIQDIHGNTPLHIASHNGHMECVKLIVENSTVRVDPNLTNKNNQTALHLASENDHKNIAEYMLIHAECNPNIEDIHRSNPLHIVSRNGHLQCMKLIIETSTVRVDLNLTNINKQTALHIACENGHRNIVKYMLTRTKFNPNVQDILGNTPLHIASHSGHMECVKLIVENSTVRVDPNLTNKTKQTALHLASDNDHRDIAEYLLIHAECNPNIKDFYGNTPLHITTWKGELEWVKSIVETSSVSIDPDVSNNDKQTALHIACKNGHRDIAEYLLTHTTCNPNALNIYGNTPLHIASQSSHMECVKLIIETSTVRADPNLTNIKKQTAVHLASENGHRNIAEYLLSHAECNPNIQDINGNTPLHIACRKGYLECVKLIVENSTISIDPNLTNKNNQTALHLACENGHRNIVDYLLTHTEFNSNIQDIHRNTPLHIVCRNGHFQYMKLIIETSTVRVDPNLTNNKKQTALFLACEYGHRNIAAYLLTKAECNPNIQEVCGNSPLHIVSRNGDLQCVKLVIETSTVRVDPNLTNRRKQTALFLACDYGHQNIAEYLLTKVECNPNVQDIHGNTPLHIASRNGHLQCMKLIIEAGTVRVDPNLTNKNNQTALHLASENGHRNITEYLLTHTTCNPNIQDIHGNTPLHIASHDGHMECVKLIVENLRVDPNLTNNNKQTALYLACEYGHRNIAEYLLTKAECNPNIQEVCGNTPLHIFSRNGDLQCVKFIVQTSTVRVDPNLINIHEQTALHLACKNGHTDIAEYLLTRTTCDPNVQDIDGNTPLHIASYNGHLEYVKLLIKTSTISIDPNSTNKNNQTALHLASENDHKNVSKYLLTHAKCNPNLRDISGNTPLYVASQNGDLECVKLIIETSVDLNMTNESNRTALHIACINGHKGIVEYLLTHAKCNPEVRDINGNTPLYVASQKGDLECVKLIIETSVDPDMTNESNRTALHIACINGHKGIVEYLLTHAKCNPKVRDIKGNTPLHLACSNGHLETVKSVIETSTVRINLDVINNNKQTALHVACMNAHKEIVAYLTSCPGCNPNIKDNHGNTPLHIVCHKGYLECVKMFIETNTASIAPNLTNSNKQTALLLAYDNGHRNIAEYLLTHTNIQDDDVGNTPLHIAAWKCDLELVKLVFESSTVNIDSDVSNNDKQTALHIAFGNGHSHIAEYLLTQAKCNPNFKGNHGNTPLHIASRDNFYDIVKLIVENVYNIMVDVHLTNNHRQTALHLACKNGHNDIVKFLLSQAKCNPNVKEENGDTPLHVASRHGHLECVETIVMTKEVNPDEPNSVQQTALHLACKHSYIRVVNFLLVNTTCNPTLKDKNGFTPLNYALSHEIIRLLIQHGADPQNVYKTYGKVLGKNKKQPPKSRTKVVITGDSGTGKTTLIEALKKEKSFLVKTFTPTDVITEVETNTAGIIPHEFKSKNYGNVTFYDLAGHREYYSSHSAVLRSLSGTSLPAALLVTDISKCDDDVKQSVTYWVNFLENQFPETFTSHNEATKLPVIVVGSHLDKVSNSSSISGKKSMIEEIINYSDSIEYVGFIPMNCQQCESAGMTKLRKCLKVCTPRLRTQERICFNARCFHIYLDKYRDLKAVSLRQVQSDISEDGEQNMEQDVSYFLPESLYHLCLRCEDLNDRGIVLFLKNATNLPDSWIVMDKSGILSEINGTVFASDNEHLASSTGVVPVSRLEETFPHYDMKMLVGVFQYFEFCHDVCDQLVKLIQEHNEQDLTCMEQADAPTFKKEHHLFFPSLVRVEAPNDLWEPNSQNQVHFGWIIQCTRPQEHFLPRFQSVLCNRLAFKFALAPDPEEIDPTIPALQRKCSVWKNGIYWGTRQGMESLVEVDTHCKSVVLLMQCRATSADFLKLRFEVIQTILKCAEEFCPRIKTAISLITRKDISYPLKPVSELTSISLPEVITAVRENSDSAVSKDGKPTPLEDLIGTGRKIEVSWLLLFTLCIAILYVFIIVNVTYW